MKQLDLKKLEGTWVEYEGFSMKIRPFPNSMNPYTMTGDITFGHYVWVVFNACVLDWKDLQDQNGKALSCNEDNKRLVFDNIDGVGGFVDEQQKKIRDEFNKEVKN